MKKVVSVSLGSSTRNHKVQAELLGEQFEISRVGVDGDVGKAVKMPLGSAVSTCMFMWQKNVMHSLMV